METVGALKPAALEAAGQVERLRSAPQLPDGPGDVEAAAARFVPDGAAAELFLRGDVVHLGALVDGGVEGEGEGVDRGHLRAPVDRSA
jgi:hypothetical protein